MKPKFSRSLPLVFVPVFLSLVACSPSEEEPEPAVVLSAESGLRAQIDELKRAVAESPTSEENIAERALVMAQWIDEYALAGGEVGVDPPRIRLQAAIPPTGNQAVTQSRLLDQYVREFSLREEDGALGFLSSGDMGPYEAGTMQTLSQTWRVGTRPMTLGGGFWVARHFAATFGEFQTTDPAGAGFISLSTTDDDARFEVETINASGPHGGFRGPQPAIAFRLVAGQLDRGSSVTISYGNRNGGGPGLEMPSFESDRMPLPLYIDLDGSGEWRPLPITPFQISGGSVAGVHGFAPSVLAPNEDFELSVRAEDRWTNRATGAIPAFEVMLNGELVATTPVGTDPISVLPLSIAEPGVYWVSIRSTDGQITGEANPILVEENPQQRVFWGDTHGHSGYSEGIGTVEHFMRFARDDARLDFVTHSEHDLWLDAGEWELIRRTSAAYDEPGEFIPFLGWEWTRHTRFGGHHNVLFRDIGEQTPVSGLDHPYLSELYEQLRKQHDSNDVVVIPHAHNPGNFRLSDPQLEPVVEVMSMHGSFQWFMQGYLSHGHEVGVVAASDDHQSRPGYSSPVSSSLAQRGGLGAVIAASKTRDNIFDGLRAKRTYATTGDRIILRMNVNGTAMGQRAPYAERRELKARIIGTAPIRTVAVYKNDEVIWEREYLLDDTTTDQSEQDFLLSFSSDETPKYNGDVPRGWRHWRGRITVTGAELLAVSATDFVNLATQNLEHEGNSISFSTSTRGDSSSLRLQLGSVSAEASIRIELDEATETGSAPPIYRSHQTIPAVATELAISGLEGGKLFQALPIEDYPDDGVTLRRVISDGARELNIELEDSAAPDQGDYYYMRVEQANDAMAWSSPIWVGGFPPR